MNEDSNSESDSDSGFDCGQQIHGEKIEREREGGKESTEKP